MQRKLGFKGALLASLALLGGCGVLRDPAFTTPADAGPYAPSGSIWAANKVDTAALAESYTLQRVHGARGFGEQPQAQLEVEPGNVWPAEEAPRATLANPDAALRGVPAWRPGEGRSARDLPIDERPGGPLVSPRADSSAPADLRPPPRRRGSSSSPPPPLARPEPDRAQVSPLPPGDNTPPPRRGDGQVLLTPNGPVVTSGGTERVQTFTTPGGGGGVIHRDGGVITVIPSGGIPQTFPAPR